MADWVDGYYGHMPGDMYVGATYRAPCETREGLPISGCEGDMCLVLAEDRFYTYVNGAWMPVTGAQE